MEKSSRTRNFSFFIAFLLSFLFTSLSFAYPTVKTLDDYWDKRQPPAGQQVIIDFLSKKEPIPKDFEIAWRVARLVYFAGNFGVGYETFNKDKKIQVFQYGYEAADIARKLKPERVEGHYWYATNLGSFGMAKGIVAALSYAEEGRDALLKAIEIDPSYHWGGPYRTIGRFYQEAPALISFGSKKKAEEYFNKAIAVSPDFRLNTIDLGVLKKELGDSELALRLLREAERKPKVDGNLEEKRYLTELSKGIQTLIRDEELE